MVYIPSEVLFLCNALASIFLIFLFLTLYFEEKKTENNRKKNRYSSDRLLQE